MNKPSQNRIDYFLIVLAVIFATANFTYGQTNSWKGLTPLRSTRADVEKLLGKPIANYPSDFTYETATETISVEYVDKRCDEGWNVEKDTLLNITVSSKAEIGKSFAELKLNKNDFDLNVSDTLDETWTNADKGLVYSFAPFPEGFRGMTYIPKKLDNNLRCNGFPPYSPETQYFTLETSRFYDLALNKKENLNRHFALLDSSIHRTMVNKDKARGYVLVYFDDKLSFNEYKKWLDAIKKHIFERRKVPTGLITIIEGGMKEQSEIEFHLLLKEGRPPSPNPTLPSPQFMRDKRNKPRLKSAFNF